jgi:hypothetical protein
VLETEIQPATLNVTVTARGIEPGKPLLAHGLLTLCAHAELVVRVLARHWRESGLSCSC